MLRTRKTTTRELNYSCKHPWIRTPILYTNAELKRKTRNPRLLSCLQVLGRVSAKAFNDHWGGNSSATMKSASKYTLVMSLIFESRVAYDVLGKISHTWLKLVHFIAPRDPVRVAVTSVMLSCNRQSSHQGLLPCLWLCLGTATRLYIDGYPILGISRHFANRWMWHQRRDVQCRCIWMVSNDTLYSAD